MDPKQKRNLRPKLDRRNALKNVEYNASSTTSSSLHPSSSFHIAAADDDNDNDNDDLSSTGNPRSRSLDLSPFYHNQKSFRIKGTDGEFDQICRSLGLSGIDDFSIPTADWEAHRSNSDLAARLRNNLVSSTSAPTPTPSRFKPAQPVKKLDEVRVRVDSVTAGPSQGIKGARPPVLSPPPVLAPPPVAGRSVAVDYTSTWELLKSFAPLEDEVVAPNTTRLGGYDKTTSSSSSSSASSEEEDKKRNEVPLESTSNRNENETENENEIENDIGIVRATNVIPVYSFSPRAKLRRSISSWQKGELLGSGSFGTVYEGYTE